MMQFSVTSTPYVRTDVTCTLPDGTGVDPTGFPVSFAFLSEEAVPTSSTNWYPGSWDETGAGFTARILVGPAGALILPAGEYEVWLQIQAANELIVLPCGPIVLY